MLKLFSRQKEAVVKPEPVAIIDIGSNSVRLVAYQGLARAPTPIFNEKVMCGLGKGVVTTGRLPEEGVEKALRALLRYRALCETMGVDDIQVVATAAARDADNGPAFLEAARRAIRREIMLLSELGKGVTLPLGGLALMDASRRSPREAIKIARKAIATAKPLDHLKGRTFYAVGGTWRSLAKLHMKQRHYPLGVMHNYRIQTGEAADFAELVESIDSDAIDDIDVVSTARRPLLAYGAIVLDEIIRRAKPREIVISAAGVREGLIYDRLSASERAVDPLLFASRELEGVFARAPGYGDELIAWIDDFMRSGSIDETDEEKRLRHAA